MLNNNCTYLGTPYIITIIGWHPTEYLMNISFPKLFWHFKIKFSDPKIAQGLKLWNLQCCKLNSDHINKENIEKLKKKYEFDSSPIFANKCFIINSIWFVSFICNLSINLLYREHIWRLKRKFIFHYRSSSVDSYKWFNS